MTHSFPTRRSSDLWSTGLDAIPLLDQRRRLFLRGIDMAAAQESVLLRAPFLDALVFLVRPCLEPRAQTVERVEERLQELVARRSEERSAGNEWVGRLNSRGEPHD